MEKIIAKVISDNGYKLEIIRPLRDYPVQIGATVEIEIKPSPVDMIGVFNNLVDDETRKGIFAKFEEASGRNKAKKSK